MCDSSHFQILIGMEGLGPNYDRNSDPWSPENIERSKIQYPSLQSILYVPPVDQPHSPYTAPTFNYHTTPVQLITQNPKLPIFDQQPFEKVDNNNRVNPDPRDLWKFQEIGNNKWGNDDPRDNRPKPKPVEEKMGNNNGWGEQNNKKPVNLFQKLSPHQDRPPVNLWSSKFASVLKRNIQLSVLQIKKKVNYQGIEEGNWFENQKKKHQSKFFDPCKELMEDLLNEQVVLLEASPHEQKLKELQRRGQVFRDQDFPPTQFSLTGEWGYVKNWKDINWKKISSIIQNPTIFDKKVVPQSIKQGILGDCYLLAGLAALAQRPQRIFNLFLTTELTPQKYFAVKILYKGMWKTIDVDQYIPTLNNKPAFSKALGPQLWVVLLQKAWAKLYGSYKNIEAGYPEEGLHDLTGAHTKMLRLQKKEFDPENTWGYLMDSTRKKYSMISSSQPGSDTNQLASGVVLGHAYTVMAVYEVKSEGKLERLVKLRNPWGRTQTKGPWNDKDPIWRSLPKEQRHRLGYVQNQHDGICFQTYRDFLKDFRTVTVAQVSDTASYVYHTQETTQFKGCYFKIKIFKEGEYSLQVNQTPDRMFSKDIQNKFKYHPITMLIGKVQGQKVRYYQGVQEPYRTVYKKHKLSPGDYVVFAKIYYSKHQNDYSVTLSIYGESVCLIEPCPNNFCPDFKEKLYMDRAKGSKFKELKTGIYYNQEILTQGYIYCALWNRSNRPAKFVVNVQKNHNPAVRLKKPFKNQTSIKISIEPNGQQLILARVPDFTSPTGGIGSVQFLG